MDIKQAQEVIRAMIAIRENEVSGVVEALTTALQVMEKHENLRALVEGLKINNSNDEYMENEIAHNKAIDSILNLLR